MKSSAIREILQVTQQPDVISFAGGMPAPELFPIEAFRQAADIVLSEQGTQALQYSITQGYPPLRRFIVEKISRYGIAATEENVLVTSGSQQALDLIGEIFVDPGDIVLTEAPTYLGALQAFGAYQARFATVPIDDEGMLVERVPAAIRQSRPKFIYVLPNFQNPAGVTLSLARRQQLVDLAHQYGVPIVEDDPYGELRYEGDHLPPLVVLASHAEGNSCGGVIYAGTFSKTLAPGLRLGWIVAPLAVIKLCVQAKQGADLHTSSFTQMIAYQVVREEGFFMEHVREIRQVYRERRDTMLAAMSKYFPPGVTWTRPQGGLFLWVTLPAELDVHVLLDKAIAQKVAFVPGTAFYPDGRGRNAMRLNFSNMPPARIEEGIRRLSQAIESEMIARRVGRVSATEKAA